MIVHLHRFHHITEDAAPLAAEVFIKNAKFCHVLDEENNFNIDLPLPKEKEEEPINLNTKDKTPTSQVNNSSENIAVEPKGLIEEMVNSETTKIRLTGNRFATFKYPIKLSQKDIDILRKHIEMLEILIE